ncbi:MAG: recombination-associated protein RdgC [Myxococcota bacterium]
MARQVPRRPQGQRLSRAAAGHGQGGGRGLGPGAQPARHRLPGFNRWLYDRWSCSRSASTKRLPAKLFRATLDRRCGDWCAERDVERIPAAIRQQLKDDLEHEWLARTLPTVGVTEAAWHVSGGWLILHSLSEGMAERYRKRFFRTFGLKLVPWSPLDWLEDGELAESLMAKAPVPVQLGVHLAEGA